MVTMIPLGLVRNIFDVRELCDVSSPFACLRQGLWFPLLDALMIPQRRIKDSDNKNVLTGNACYILFDNKVMPSNILLDDKGVKIYGS